MESEYYYQDYYSYLLKSKSRSFVAQEREEIAKIAKTISLDEFAQLLTFRGDYDIYNPSREKQIATEAGICVLIEVEIEDIDFHLWGSLEDRCRIYNDITEIDSEYDLRLHYTVPPALYFDCIGFFDPYKNFNHADNLPLFMRRTEWTIRSKLFDSYLDWEHYLEKSNKTYYRYDLRSPKQSNFEHVLFSDKSESVSGVVFRTPPPFDGIQLKAYRKIDFDDFSNEMDYLGSYSDF